MRMLLHCAEQGAPTRQAGLHHPPATATPAPQSDPSACADESPGDPVVLDELQQWASQDEGWWVPGGGWQPSSAHGDLVGGSIGRRHRPAARPAAGGGGGRGTGSSSHSGGGGGST